jgi:DNA-directed RNA polymerase beta subunit
MIQRFEAKIPKKLNYEGAIYCVTVPNEIFYVRRNGCSVWTGNSRSTGPYSIITQQPLRGRSKHGGQRLGEMEVWALEGYGAAFILLEMLTIKSDNINGRLTLWSKYLTNRKITIGIPESFYVLVSELRAICLNIGLFV